MNKTHDTPTPPPGAVCLITGLTGQDGFYLARILLRAGCNVVGAALKDDPALEATLAELKSEGPGRIDIRTVDLTNETSVEACVAAARPAAIYHLAAQSHVGTAWEKPVLTAQINAMGTLFLLDAARRHAPGCGFVFAASADCFDHEAARAAGGLTPAMPYRTTNPYAASKLYGMQMTACHREHYGLRAVSAILFNHTSQRRPPHFIERGIVRQAVEVARGDKKFMTIGSLDSVRDWSWAEDLMEAFAAMGAMEEPEDLVLASGVARTTGDWVREACRQLGLDPEKAVRLDSTLCHKGDRPHAWGSVARAQELLGWTPRTDLEEMTVRLIAAEQAGR